ncbi:hypothetical protein P1X14_19005 [Sphingomonas sp. AOB5]|uniref:hypothetical protein n=1 Tax=Sphingomonas sp. AOB5 TaxID=3034017 RepID=UPI0023F764E5|nr:hypothetical protein [Sphingomonas sp. AOB5]MDF7777355.1 hypothetical protein [Sphingomonas sp. AOB5]
MTGLEDLLREGEALARPCFRLTADGEGSLGGYWGGARTDAGALRETPVLRDIEHLLTLDPALIAAAGIPVRANPISLYEVTMNGELQLRLAESTAVAFEAVECSGDALFAVPAVSLPPLAALCLHGGDAVSGWLASLGLERHQYEAAAAAPLGRDYEDVWFERSVFHGQDCDVIVGGWHQQWPDDDFYMPREMRLVAVTLRDAEPWRELWRSETGNLSARERVS